jgi:hypothetical protein
MTQISAWVEGRTVPAWRGGVLVRGRTAPGGDIEHLGSSVVMSRDPRQGADQESAHDVLAAEAFAMPAPDPQLRPGPVVLPEDPSGIAEPHDILAAEEFAMPAGAPAASSAGAGPSLETRRRVAVAAAAGGLLALLRLRRRH